MSTQINDRSVGAVLDTTTPGFPCKPGNATVTCVIAGGSIVTLTACSTMVTNGPLFDMHPFYAQTLRR